MEGLTLNEILMEICDQKYHLELDKNILREYEKLEDQKNLIRGLGNLIEEMNTYGPLNKKKVVTQLEKDSQIVKILSSGSPLSKEKLDSINSRYSEGANTQDKPYRNGTKIAAYFLAQLNGTITIENCNEEDYTIKNIIKLPA